MTSEITTLSLKRQFIAALETLPEDATLDDAIECLILVNKVQIGIAQADAGMLIPHDEVMKRMGRWRK
ncbi:MAG: hypothetical protein ACYDCQ_06800 [Dehalococcoidia bacterium]